MQRSSLLHEAVVQLAVDIDCRLNQCGNLVTPAEQTLRWELACCILSSQVPYRLAATVATDLQGRGVLDDIASRNPAQIRITLEEAMSSKFDVGSSMVRYRFPQSKADQLAQALVTIHDQHGTLTQFVNSVRDPHAARRWMIEDVAGIGPKQASMFLRNSGASYDLAVIDRHVLQFMQLQRLQPNAVLDPNHLTGYETLEESLRQYAANIGYALGIVDWSIWFVMRAAKALDHCK